VHFESGPDPPESVGGGTQPPSLGRGRQHESGQLGSAWHDEQTIAGGQPRVQDYAVFVARRNRRPQVLAPHLLSTRGVERIEVAALGTDEYIVVHDNRRSRELPVAGKAPQDLVVTGREALQRTVGKEESGTGGEVPV
jgi:hypothetical protein